MYVKESEIRQHIENNDMDQFAVILYKMANGLFDRYFSNQSLDQDEMVQAAVVRAFTKVDKFQSGKGTAFNFFTTVIMNEMLGHLKKKKPITYFSYLPSVIVDAWTAN